MKKCPNCGELLGDNIESCFKCKYDFIAGCIPENILLDQQKRREEARMKREAIRLQRTQEMSIEENKHSEDLKSQRIQLREELERSRQELKRRREEEKKAAEELREKENASIDEAFEAPLEKKTKINDIYEYDVVSIRDSSTGAVDINKLYQILSDHGKRGWRLVNTFTNELGITSSGLSVGGLGVSTNATIDQTILIFERCVRRASISK